MTGTTIADDECMATARAVVAQTSWSDCTALEWHDGEHGHRAIRLYGPIYPENARWLGSLIEKAIFGLRDPETGLYGRRHVGFVQQAGFAAVWIR